jgi:hypothetical protein
VSLYEDHVFLNVPFDRSYVRLFRALVFAISDCGLVPRTALEVEDSGEARVDKIFRIIEESKFGVHDISRAGIDRNTRLARFNMPLELGFFLGAKRFGADHQRRKFCLILDREKFRYRNFCSDIAGQDIRNHNGDPREAIRAVRDWLNNHRTGAPMPGGKAIFDRYEQFRAQLSGQAASARLHPRELSYGDYVELVNGWLSKTPW